MAQSIATRKPRQSSSNQASTIEVNQASTIEVCQGPDCFGAGGGAAFLAIEDLAMTASTRRGGCRNLCSMGPNVYYYHEKNTNGYQELHFTKVSSMEECRNVVLRSSFVATSDTTDMNKQNSETRTTSTLSKLRQRQSDKLQWQALRLMARIQKSPVQVSLQQTEAARTAVMVAASSQDQGAIDTGVQLVPMFQRILDENAELSSESEEEDG